MIDINNWLGRDKKKLKDAENNLGIEQDCKDRLDEKKHEVIVACSFLCISSLGNKLLICIHKEDDEECVYNANEKFAKAVEERQTVVLYNYKVNTYKKWNPFSKLLSEGEIPLVDFDSLIEVIREIQNCGNPLYLKAGKFNRLLFAVTYKMVKEGIFGVKNNDISYRDYVDMMNSSGLDAGQKSNLEEHLKKMEGKSPFIRIKQNDTAKSQETTNYKIRLFIEDIISRYIKKSNKTSI